MAVIHAYHIMNIGLHIIILFSFLTLFFFFFISKKEKQGVSDEVKSSVSEATVSILDKIHSNEKKYKIFNVDWEKVYKGADQMEQSSHNVEQFIVNNNRKLKVISIGVIIGCFILLVAFFLYFRFYRKFKLPYGEIITSNVIAFTFVAGVEYLFFSYIASKYSPIFPSLIVSSSFDKAEDIIYDKMSKV